MNYQKILQKVNLMNMQKNKKIVNKKSGKANKNKTGVNSDVKIVVTHGANFHADDLFAVAATLLWAKKVAPNQKWKVIRSLDPKVWAKADVLLDIGFTHNPKKNRFDHHQEGGAGKRESGVPYAAFGLFWKKYGKVIAGSQEAAEYVDKHLIAGLDAADNGVDVYRSLNENASPYLFINYVKDEMIDIKESSSIKKNFDPLFKKLIPLAQRVILIAVKKAYIKIKAKKIIAKAYAKAKDKRVIVTENYAPRDFNDFPEVLFYIYKNLRGGWAVETVPVAKDTTETKVSLPKAWRGKRAEELAKISGVADATFCHLSGFLGAANSKEGAIKMAYLAIEQGDRA